MLKNSLYNVVGAAIRLGLSILISPLLISTIGLEGFGIWIMISAVVTLFGLAEVGLSITSAVFFSQDLSSATANEIDSNLSQTLTTTALLIIVFASVAGIGLWLASPVILYTFPALSATSTDRVIWALRLGSLLIWFRLLQLIPISLEHAHQQFGFANLVNTFQVVATVLGLWLISRWGALFDQFIVWQTAVSFLSLVVHILFCFHLLKTREIRFALTYERTRAVLKYSLPSWVTQIGSAVFQNTDRIIVGALLGSATLGIYSTITLIAVQVNNFSAIAVQPRFGLISQAIKSQKDTETLLKLVQNSFVLCAVLAFSMGCALLGVSTEVIHIMLPGLETVQYILAFKVAVLIYSLYSLNAVGTFVLYGYGKVTVCAWVVLACSCATLAAIALGASIAGLLGAIAGNSIFIFTVFLLNLAMKYVKEDGFAWLTWIKVPLIIFTIGTLCQLLIKMENPLRWVILIAQCSAIVLWAYFHLFSGMSAKLLHLVPKRWLATSNKQKV